MNLHHGLGLLAAAGFVAGMMNAVAGGGSFVTFPALVAAGLPSVAANASSTVALFPGQLTTAYAYREQLRDFDTLSMRLLVPLSLAGGVCGALLLLLTPQSTFDRVIPWLLLAGTIAFAFGPRLGPDLRRFLRIGGRTLVVLQFMLAVYGGYFGGAVGILMLALWSIGLGLDPAGSNPMRVTQLAAVYLTATVLFLFASDVLAAPLLPAGMLVGALVGGVAGAHLGRRLPARLLRAVVLATAVTMTVLYFLRG
ncbi:MAG: sulfite exporter TauE/SafE family protein [Myxococcales bacterium]